METPITPPAPVAGLLPGVDLVRIGVAEADEFEQVGDRLFKGPRGMSQCVVRPAKGYTFKFEIESNAYAPVKELPAKRTFTICFEAEDDWGLKRLDKIRQVLGVVSVTEVLSVGPDVGNPLTAPAVPQPDAAPVS